MHVMGKRVGCDGAPFYQIAMNPGWGTAFDESTIPLKTWTHLAQTWDGLNALLYMNGRLVHTWDGSTFGEDSAPFEIGQAGDCQPFGGLVDEPAIYARALTQSELQSIVDAGSAGKCLEHDIRGGESGLKGGTKNVSCENVTTGQVVNLRTTRNQWNCTEAGLVVSEGDKIIQSVTGHAKGPD